MLYPLKMVKVRMIGLTKDLSAALSLWRRLGAIELNTTPYDKLKLQKGQALGIYEQISEHLIRIRGVKNALPKREVISQKIKNPIEEAKQITIGPKILEIRKELKELKKKKEPLESSQKEFERLAPLQIDFSQKPSQVQFTILSCNQKDFPKVKKAVSKITKSSDWLTHDESKDTVLALLATPKGTELTEALQSCAVLKTPNIEETPRQALLDVQSRLEDINQRTKTLNFELDTLSEKYYSKIVALEEALTMDSDLAREATKFGNSAQCFFATGWIKQRDYEKFKNTTEKLLNKKIAIQIIPESEHHFKGAPTVLQNPKVARPFQFLVEFLGMPKSTELDPTLLTLFTIPIAYGMIVGDAGYALISILIAWLISKNVEKRGMMWNFARIWQIGAIPTFIFGVLYDEYFGFSHEDLIGHSYYSPIIHRVGNVEGLLLFTIITGWLYIAIGFLLGAINEWNHSKKHSFAKLTWIIVQIGGTLVVGTFLLNAFSMDIGIIGAAMLGVGIVALGVLEGPISLVEVPGLAANIMSFARIAAVGVAGVILAEAINTLIMPNPSMLMSVEGIILFVIMSLVYAGAHAANAFIAMFEGFIHGARLSVVEVFQKFFHGGGKPFNPFMLKRKYTLDSNSSVELK